MDNPAGPALDVRRLLATFNDHNVDYVIVGGLAALIHGATRPTYDADLVIDNHHANLDRFVKAVTSIRGRRRVDTESLDHKNAEIITNRKGPGGWRGQDLPGEFLSLQTDAGPIDVLPHIPIGPGTKLWYHDLLADASTYSYSDNPGTVTKIASLDHIIASKEHINRPKDREALPELKAIQQQQLERSRGAQPSQRARDDDHGHSL